MPRRSGQDPRRPAARRRAAHRLLAASAAAVVIGAVAALTAGGSGAAPTIPRSAVRVDIGANAVSRPVAPGFIGLSIEYPSARSFFGSPGHPDLVFDRLVRNLTPGQSPVLRFGGDTTDWTWWPAPGIPRPRGIRYAIGPRWIAATRAAAVSLNARLILGVNFEADSATIAATEASHLLDGIGRGYVAGLELGNEPEVYATLPWYTSAPGAGVPGRPASYGFGAYLRDYARVARALPRSVPLVGPASGASAWLDGLGRYLAANRRVRTVTFHRYPLHRCFTPRTSPQYPTMHNLLAPGSSIGPAESLQAAVRLAHAHGLPLRSDEFNSVSCAGAKGVSDTFASALWVLGALFNMARVGVDGVNIHTFRHALYAPFWLRYAGGRWTAQVKPMYYGMLLFARAAPAGSRLLAGPGRAIAPLSIWATRAPDAMVRVTLINESLRRSVLVAVRAPTGAGSADVQRLRAPRVGARSGVSLGGQTFGASTATGALAASSRRTRVSAIQGRFVVRLPPASATLLTAG